MDKKALIREPEIIRLLGRPSRRWEDNIKIVLSELDGKCGLNSSASGYGPVQGSCKQGNEPYISLKFSKYVERLGIC
jgi:hypothetical protein